VARAVRETARSYRGDEPSIAARIVGFDAFDTATAVRRLEAGLPIAAFERLREALGLRAEELAALLQVPPRTLARRKSEGRLRPDESERLLRFTRLLDRATALFEGDVRGAVAWLSAPRKALSGETALAWARTEIGARAVEDLIGRLEHGVGV
jgi:putative toxin-antitoxin system antitoxin component (TIGR02293 family)